jgi:flagellar L-ring protein precursor FlgH
VEGSLWTDNRNDQFFVDLRAKRVGDTVTVDIVENTSSSIDANTKAGRSSDIDARIDNMATFMRTVENKSDRLGKDRDGTFSGTLFKAGITNAFDGQGTSDRSGKVTASIGAIVTDVLPNGNLVLHGNREMKVNNEIQYISVSGVARPRDIGTDNRIKSIFLANSRIEYAGKGVIADKQRPGWATRILDQIWPF